MPKIGKGEEYEFNAYQDELPPSNSKKTEPNSESKGSKKKSIKKPPKAPKGPQGYLQQNLNSKFESAIGTVAEENEENLQNENEDITPMKSEELKDNENGKIGSQSKSNLNSRIHKPK